MFVGVIAAVDGCDVTISGVETVCPQDTRSEVIKVKIIAVGINFSNIKYSPC
jgi:hypothetical protein